MDTPPPSQAAILRQLDGPTRWCIAFEMSDFAHSLAVAGILSANTPTTTTAAQPLRRPVLVTPLSLVRWRT